MIKIVVAISVAVAALGAVAYAQIGEAPLGPWPGVPFGVGSNIPIGPSEPGGGGGGGATNALLLEAGGSNFLLLEDGASHLCLESGC